MSSELPCRRAAGVLVALTIALPLAMHGASSSPPNMQSLFPWRAEIVAERPGLARLLLPPEVLAECRADLSDLRVVNALGREVAYLVDGGPPPEQVLEERVVFEPRLLAASRETEERDSAPDLVRESYRLSLPEGGPRPWDLVVRSGRSRFVRRLDVAAIEDGREVLLVEEGSVFRLQSPLRERLTVTLPSVGADYLVVTLEGEEDAFLAPSFRLESSRLLPEREQARVDLAVRKSASRAGRTVIELERPRGLVPDQLVVSTATGSFNRRFEVWDQGSGSADSALGSGTLYRLAGADDVEGMELALEPARGDALRVIIEDGDSPPLEQPTFQAVLRRPSLVFSLDGLGADKLTGALLYGGARAFRPRYDLAALLRGEGREATGEEARIAAQVRDPTRLAAVRLGPSQPNPLWDPAPALAFAMRPGTEIATWKFEYRRSVSVPPTNEGLLRLGLDAETVARCRDDLADLRLVDTRSRQWPYLLARVGSVQRIPLDVRGPRTEKGRSTYLLDLPASPLSLEQVLLDGPAPYFDRPFELLGTPPGRGERALPVAGGRLTRRPEDPRELAVSLRRLMLASLELRIEDGDDPPLEWSSVEARLPMPEIFFAAPQGDYTLLFGDPDAHRPRYELERVRDLVLAVDSTRVRAGELIENRGRGVLSRFRGDGGWQQILLWSALVLAALVLAGITLKLARQDPASS